MSVSFGKRTQDALNKQISEELASAYLYMGMASVLKDMGLDGCSHWMMLQAQEERGHAIKIFDHMLARNAKIKLLPIAAPKQDWRAPMHIFEEMLRHEQKVTTEINAIYEIAGTEKDYQTQCFISWFVQEQVEEESVAASLFDRLKKMQSTDLGVLMFDAELARRV